MVTKAQLDADMAHAIGVIQGISATYSSVTIGATPYACALEEVTSGEALEFAGVVEEVDTIIHIRRALFTGSLPASGATVTAGGKTFRIVQVVVTPNDLEVRLLCEDVTK